MTTPNWQHNSGKDAKRTLKPQAMRSAKARTQALINKLSDSEATKPTLNLHRYTHA